MCWQMKIIAKPTCTLTRVKSFTFRLIAKNIRNIMPYLMVCFTPLGWVTALFSGLRLFGVKGLRNLLNPLWGVTLANLIIRRVGKRYFLAYSPLRNIKFLANNWDAVYIFYHVWICRDYERFVKPKGIIVDCGAHIGLFTLRCLKSLNAAFVIAIEPNPLNARLLRMNLLMNGVDKFLLIEVAAGSSNDEIKLFLNNLSSRSSVVRETAKYIRVKQVKLDDVIPALAQRIDFIKIDVEGAELEVLKGASKLIERDKPVLVIETGNGNLRRLLDYFKKHYKIYVSHFGGVHVVCLPYE
jgi:FkbM family methyltransferase